MSRSTVINIDYPTASAESSAGDLKTLGGSEFEAFNNFIANGAVRSLWMGGKSESDCDTLMSAAVSALVGIKPQDELEGMLAAQLLATHAAAMECYRRAMIPDQTFEGRQAALSQGGKLSRTHAQLLETLNRHRGRGAQRIVVERVDVQSGGQAIVGAINTAGAGAPQKSKDQPHAKSTSDASEPEVRSEDAARDALSGASRSRKAKVPNARRCGRKRSAKGE